MNTKTLKVKELEYDIDYDLFTTNEVIKIINFFNTVVRYHTKQLDQERLIKQYQTYREIINNKALEKKYDAMFFKQTNISIYQLMKELLK